MTASPLTGPPPAEVPLPDAPLVRVIAQVRFPIVTSVEERSFVAPFQEAIRDSYPVMRQEAASNLLLRGGGSAAVEVHSSVVWRLHDVGQPWRVTLAADFLTLETSRYTSREDFFARFAVLLDALEAHVRPAALDRLGVRYIDRLTGAALSSLHHVVNPALLGVLGTEAGRHARVAVSECLFDLPDEGGQLLTRWGMVPAGATIDPGAIEPLAEPSWVLDIDAFRSGERRFAASEVAGEAVRLAERAYAFFRWSVTDAFIAHFGGAS